MISKNPFGELHALGQSIWYDNIRRALLTTGDLKRKIQFDMKGVTSTLSAKIGGDDLRGVTSNPAIFEKAIAGSTDYNDSIQKLVQEGKNVNEIYEALVLEDIAATADLLLPVYERTNGIDGYVSLEVSPKLAHDTQGTIEEARRLFATLNRKNVMIKVPATAEGIPAIEQLISDGININVTLIFSKQSYEEVANAYIRGLEKRIGANQPVNNISSVASFFVSRIDTNIDSQLEFKIRRSEDEAEKKKLTGLLGKAAIANAKIAYQKFKEIFHGDRFKLCASKGARVQRQLWASTGTKNPRYSDVYYVEELIGPETVNTVPPATYTAFRDHGKVRPSLEEDVDGAKRVIAELAEVGINLDQVTEQLQTEGVEAFINSFDGLFESIEAKKDAIISGILDRMTATLGTYNDKIQETIKTAEKEQWVRKIWHKDAALWKEDEAAQKIIKNALGWLTVVEQLSAQADDLQAFADRVRKAGFNYVMLLGMGGSSLCPEVFRRTFGKFEDSPELLVLDSTVPETVQAFEKRVDLESTLFIVSSKSGTTTEPLVFYKYFFDRVKQLKGDRTGENFVTVTDPGTLMEKMATDDKFRRIFLNPADIGGRYSALSYFGAVPASLQGFDFKTLWDRAECIVHACSSSVATSDNPGARLGAIIGTLAREGRDKLTLVISPEIASLGLWIEQLIAESTGKEGRGILPVAGEDLGAPGVYGNDRQFVYVGVGKPDDETEKKLRALEAAGHPVVRRMLNDKINLGEEFFLWEFATAFAGVVLNINTFDQPNVQESKDNTKALLEQFTKTGKLPEQSLAVAEGDLRIFCDDATKQALSAAASSRPGSSDLASYMTAHLSRVKAGDYIALLDYIQETDEHEAIIQQIRTHLRDALKVATTTGYGPRFLHSTGQLHKGGSDAGVFIQVTFDSSVDVPIPGQPYTYNTLKQAQALGDF
ncbi:MAG TPA: bifunctional transaldolase/phosoglucose isomerase, partial [Blastocatellia bacterium]|nr:bifunctional transaldolase/phosoglucose isomerase [Blastocatellia bacterium]